MLRGWPCGSRGTPRCRSRPHVDLEGRPVHISVRTLQRWRAAWASRQPGRPGAAAAHPHHHLAGAARSELVAFLHTEKQRDAHASVPELVRRARERGIIPVDAEGSIAPPCGAPVGGWACRRAVRPHKRDGRHAALALCRAHAVRARRRQAFPCRRGAVAAGRAVLPRRCHPLRSGGAGGHRGVQRAVPARPLPRW